MATKKIKATAQLFLDTKNAQSDAAKFVNDLKQKLNSIEDAVDKMSVFKDLVGYIGQVDKALSALKNKNADAFSHMFDGLDTDLREQMEEIFGVSGSQLGQIDVLREKLATLTPKSGIKEVRNFAKEINKLFSDIGADAPFDIEEQFKGKINAGHIELLTKTLDNFATTWSGVNKKISEGFNFGGTGGSGTSKLSEETQQEIDKLNKQKQEYQEIINIFYESGNVNISLPKKSADQVEQLKNLKNAFKEAEQEKMRFEINNQTGSSEYLVSVAKYTKAAAQLKAAFEYDNLTDKSMEWINIHGLDDLENADKALTQIFNKQKTTASEISQLYSNKISGIDNDISFLTKPYDTLKEKIQEYVTLQHKLNDDEGLSDDEEDEIYSKASALEKYILSLDQTGNKAKEITQMFGNVQFGDIDDTGALEQLCNILGVQIPDAAAKSEQVLNGGVGDSSFNDTVDDNIKHTKIKLQEYNALIDEINNIGFDWSAEGNVDIGKYTERLDTAKRELDALGEQGLITASELEAVQAAFNESKDRLQGHTVHYTGYGNGHGDYNYTYYDEYQEQKDRADLLEEENLRLKDDLSKKPSGEGVISGDNNQVDEFNNAQKLLAKIEELKAAVDAKTQAFVTEANTVDSVVSQEIGSLQKLESYLNELKTVVQESMTGSIDQWGTQIEALYPKIQQLGQEFSDINEAIRSLGADLNLINEQDGASKQFAIKMDTTTLDSSMSDLSGKVDSNTQSIGGLTTAVDNLAGIMKNSDIDGNADRDQQIEYMKKNLLQVFSKVANHNKQTNHLGGEAYTQQETLAEFLADGSVRFGYGENGTVQWRTMIESILSNILSKSVMSMHSHPWGDYFGNLPGGNELDMQVFANDTFSGSTGDFGAWKTIQQYGARIGSMLTGSIMHTFDIGKISNKYDEFLKNLKDTENAYASSGKYDEYFKQDLNGKIYLMGQSDLKGWHEQSNIFTEIMLESLKKTGFSDAEIGDIYKEYDLTNNKDLTNLATTLVDLSSASATAESKVDALKNLLMAVGSTNYKDNIQEAADYFRRAALGMTYGYDLDANYNTAKDYIREYSGDTYDTELAEIDKIVNKNTLTTNDMLEAANKLSAIAKNFGTDIESNAGEVALEAFRKGEMSIAEVWNNFSDLATVSQAAIDNMQVIDTSKENSTEVQLMSQMVSSLASIDAKTSSIEANTQPTLENQLNASAQTLENVIYNSSVAGVENNTHSLFDANNVSEFKVQELYKIADNAVKAFNHQLTDVIDRDAYGNQEIDPVEAQRVFDTYTTAVARVQDAQKQLDAYQTRYNTMLIDHNTGAMVEGDIEALSGFLSGQFGNEVEQLVDVISKARQNLANNMDLDTRTAGVSIVDDFDDTNDTDLLPCLSKLSSAIDALTVKIGTGVVTGTTQSEIVGTAIQNPMGNVDISSETNKCYYLLDVLERIADKVQEKTRAFEEEKRIVDGVIPAEVETLRKLGEYLETLKITIEGLFNNTSVSTNVFEAWKNDLVVVKTSLDGIIQNLRDIEALSLQDGQALHQNVGRPNGSYALEGTLQTTNGILTDILGSINADSDFAKIAATLTSATEDLKKVASGIIEHQKAQRTDLTDSSVRVANNYGQLSSIAGNAVTGLGDNVQIENMKALADNVVRVKGAVQDTSGVWKGFVVDIDEANNAVVRAVDEQSALAKTLNESAEVAKKAENETKNASKQDDVTKSLSAQKSAFGEYKNSLRDVDYLTNELNDDLDELAIRLQAISDADGLEGWKDDFNNLRKQINIAKSAFNETNNGYINSAKKNLKSRFNKLTDDQKLEVQVDYEQAIADLEKYKVEVQNGKKVELEAINSVTSALHQQIDAYQKVNEEAKKIKQVETKNQKFGSTTEINSMAKLKSLQSQASSGEFANSTVVQQMLQQTEDAYDRLIAKKRELNNSDSDITKDQEAEFKQLQNEYSNLAKALNKIITDTHKLNAQFANSDPYVLGDDFVDDKEGRKAALADFVQQTYGISVAAEDFKDNWNKVVFAIDNGDGTFTNMTATFNAARTQIGALSGDVQKTTGTITKLWNEFKTKIGTIGTYLAASFGWQEVWQQLRQGVQYVREIDSALTELKKVTNETDAAYDQFLQDMSKTGSVIGSTVAELTSSAADWARLNI